MIIKLLEHSSFDNHGYSNFSYRNARNTSRRKTDLYVAYFRYKDGRRGRHLDQGRGLRSRRHQVGRHRSQRWLRGVATHVVVVVVMVVRWTEG